MNTRIALCLAALVLADLGLASPALAQTRGQLKLPEFAALTDKASESVNVTMDPQVLGLACRFLNSNDPEQAQVQKMCTSLTGVYVRHYSFDADYAYPKADVDGVRKQLGAPGWSQMVEAHSRKENTNVVVYMHTDGGKARGLAIIASEPREFTIVNIVGSIDLEQLHDLEGKFGIPNLEIETGKSGAQKPPPPAPKK